MIDPHTTALSRADKHTYDEFRAKMADWLWKINQYDEIAAERARHDLVVAIENHHEAARRLQDAVTPRRGKTIGARPLSKDEEDLVAEQRARIRRRRSGIDENETIV